MPRKSHLILMLSVFLMGLGLDGAIGEEERRHVSETGPYLAADHKTGSELWEMDIWRTSALTRLDLKLRDRTVRPGSTWGHGGPSEKRWRSESPVLPPIRQTFHRRRTVQASSFRGRIVPWKHKRHIYMFSPGAVRSPSGTGSIGQVGVAA